MTGKLSENFHGVGIGPLSKILAVKYRLNRFITHYLSTMYVCILLDDLPKRCLSLKIVLESSFTYLLIFLSVYSLEIARSL